MSNSVCLKIPLMINHLINSFYLSSLSFTNSSISLFSCPFSFRIYLNALSCFLALPSSIATGPSVLTKFAMSSFLIVSLHREKKCLNLEFRQFNIVCFSRALSCLCFKDPVLSWANALFSLLLWSLDKLENKSRVAWDLNSFCLAFFAFE